MPTNLLAVRVLLVSNDTQTIEKLCYFMQQMSMDVEVCSDIDSAASILCHSQFEAVIVDFTFGSKALTLMETLRQMTSHKGAVVMAVLNNSTEMTSAFGAGARFTIVRPMAPPIVTRTLKASYPFMVREMRRYYRCPIELPIYIVSNDRPALVAESLNISEGGMAFSSSTEFAVGEELELMLSLPGRNYELRIQGEVCWANGKGRVGLQFVHVPITELTQLQSWLAEKIEDQLAAEPSLFTLAGS
ncbi:MAG: PilZ domain-containing protein [Candidatus Sulfotelmatobacter sp.]